MALPAEGEVYERLLALKAVVAGVQAMPRRDLLEQVMLKWSYEDKLKFKSEAEQQQVDRVECMKRSGVYDLTTPAERELLRKNSYNLDGDSYAAAIWKMECVAVLMWALALLAGLPDIDHAADGKLLKRIPDDCSAPPPPLQLRGAGEIEAAREDVERWHWRSRTWFMVERGAEFRPDRTGSEQGWRSFDDMVRAVACRYHEEGCLREIKDGDFVVGGTPFRDLRFEAWKDVEGRLGARHHALNWLCGYSPDNRWDDTPTGG